MRILMRHPVANAVVASKIGAGFSGSKNVIAGHSVLKSFGKGYFDDLCSTLTAIFNLHVHGRLKIC